MERISDFEKLIILYKTEGKGISLEQFLSTMALTIVSLPDGTAITMKVPSKYRRYRHALWISHLMQIVKHNFNRDSYSVDIFLFMSKDHV